QRAEPRGLADEMFERLLYEPGSRYAIPAEGDEQTVKSILRDDVTAFHADRYRPASTTIVVAGDVKVDAAAELVERAFGGWAGEAAAAVPVLDTPARTERMTHLVAKTDAPQSELRIGHVG